MNTLLINGRETNLPFPPHADLRETLNKIKNEFRKTGEMITSVAIDGISLSPEKLQEMMSVNTDDFNTLEVRFATSGKVYDDLLISLEAFTHQLIKQSTRLAAMEDGVEFEKTLQGLINGLDAFFDSLFSLSLIRKKPLSQEVKVIIEDLKSILSDFVDAREQKHSVFTREILQKHIPENLKEWLEIGITELQQNRPATEVTQQK